MAKPAEICAVVVNGYRYDLWETVEVASASDQVIDHAMLTVAEPSSGAATLAAVKMKPGDLAQVYLAGSLVLDGRVYLRQGACDKTSHSVQIGICSKAQPIMTATVRNSPGQYLNQTLTEILTKVFGEEGVPFSMRGAPAGADKPFPRVSEFVGETKFDFAQRLAMMRNIHLSDDGNGGIVGYRGPNGDAKSTVVEGKNLLRGRILLKNNESAELVIGVGQRANQVDADQNRGSNASKAFTTTAPTSLIRFGCEDMADSQDCALRVAHETDWLAYQEVDGEVTVQGWINQEGKLWWNDRLKLIVVRSPLLLPNNSFGFAIKSVVHRQSNEEGTTTTLQLCRADGLGAGNSEPIQ